MILFIFMITIAFIAWVKAMDSLNPSKPRRVPVDVKVVDRGHPFNCKYLEDK